MILIPKLIKILFLFLTILCLNYNFVSCDSSKAKRGILDNINHGFKVAGQMLGINTASDVANLVAAAFSKINQPNAETTSREQWNEQKAYGNEHYTEPWNLFSNSLRIMGLDNRKIGAVLLNGILFIAQMIATALLSKKHLPFKNEGSNQESINFEETKRSAREGFPLDWILQDPPKQILNLLPEIQDENLSKRLINKVKTLEKEDGEGSCTKQLICKIIPFIIGMQKSVGDKLNKLNQQTNSSENTKFSYFYKYLPNIEDYKLHSKQCEEEYRQCKINLNF